MAITKIHPIKSTLNLAIDYIVNGDKTDEQLLVSTHKCHESTAHTQFLRTRNDAGTKGTVLARHLIQSFLPGETSPELAHQIGMELCKKILKDEYEFVLSTHVDKGHIHNHIIFNNVNMVTGGATSLTRKATTKSVIRVINSAKKIAYLSLTSFTKAIRRNIRLTVNLGMKTNRQSMALLGKVNFNLTLIE